ncbi:MAG: AsmA family protein, partial [Stellaceae bacterium]
MTRGRIALFAVAAVVVAVAAAVLLVPLNSFRGPIATAASNALKRQVTIRGSLHLSLFPKLGIVLKDVSIANAAGARDPKMVTVGRILVGARLLPLLHGDLQVTRVVLKQPVIHLEIGKDGVGNWQFGKQTTGSAANPFAPDTLGFRQARIENGEVTYFDARTGQTEALNDVSLSLATAPSQAARALKFTGTATYNRVPVKFAGSLADLDQFLDGKPSNGQVHLGSTMVDADLTGRFTAPGAITGTLKLTAPSLRRLAAWAGEALPPGNGLGAIAVNARVAAHGGVYTLSRAGIALDRMKLTGDLSIDDNAKVPTLKGTLAIDHFDARPYLAPGTAGNIASAEKRPQRNEKLALGGLEGVNADLVLTLGGLVLPDIKVDHAVVAATLRGGVLKARLTRLAAYGGAGSGSVSVDATGAVPSLHTTLDMSGINVRSFLGEVIGIDRISGTGAVRLDVASRGATE